MLLLLLVLLLLFRLIDVMIMVRRQVCFGDDTWFGNGRSVRMLGLARFGRSLLLRHSGMDASVGIETSDTYFGVVGEISLFNALTCHLPCDGRLSLYSRRCKLTPIMRPLG